jgi:nuclear transcription Y subunit beta
MSATPPKKVDVEPGVQSPDDSEPPMDREAQDTQAQGLGYEFEVKEQDRWLPIANGWSFMHLPLVLICALFPSPACEKAMTGVASSPHTP